MSRIAWPGLAAVLVWLAGIGPLAQPAQAAVHYLVTTGGDGEFETHWLRVEPDEVVVEATVPHLVVFAGDEPWAWRTYHFQVPTCPCPNPSGDLLALDEPTCGEEAGGDALQLVGLVSGEQREVVGIRARAADGGELQRVSLLGALGPLLLLREDQRAAGCGSHERVSARFVAFHAGLGREVELLTADEVGRLLLLERTEAWQQLRRDSAIYPIESAEDISHTATLADLSRGGLELIHQFSAAACHECSDGQWSSGTRSVRVAAREVPGRLAPFTQIPVPVATFDGGDAPLSTPIRGVSPVRAEAERIPILLAAFRDLHALEQPPVAGTDPRFGEISGVYGSDTGTLAMLALPDGVGATYSSVFQTTSFVPHMCDCELLGAAAGEGDPAYTLGAHGTRLETGPGWARLSPPAPECCGLGWPGDELVRTADLPRCSVIADTAKLLETPGGKPLRTFVIAGDRVTVLPPLPEDDPEHLLVRFHGAVTTTYGYLRRDALDCPFD